MIIDRLSDLEESEAIKEKLQRSELLGEGNRLVVQWRRSLTKSLGYYNNLGEEERINKSFDHHNAAVNFFNQYVTAKNKQFKGNKNTLEDAVEYLEDAQSELDVAIGIYDQLNLKSRRAVSAVNRARTQSKSLMEEVKSELIFVRELKSQRSE